MFYPMDGLFFLQIRVSPGLDHVVNKLLMDGEIFFRKGRSLSRAGIKQITDEKKRRSHAFVPFPANQLPECAQ
jgi:hypothetical protein